MDKMWSRKEVDEVYNGGAGAGGLAAWILDEVTGFNKSKGYTRLITTVFAGVGVGGTLAYAYLYYQGIYEEGYVFSDYKPYRR